MPDDQSTLRATRIHLFTTAFAFTLATAHLPDSGRVGANERRITINAPGGQTPANNWAFGLSIRNNPTAGGSTTVAVPAGTSSSQIASAVAAAVTNEMGINATTNGNTVIISQHNQDPGFDFDPLAPGTKMGTSFGGLSGPGGTNGFWGVSRAFRVWAPNPPPPPAPIPLAQHAYSIVVPGEVPGMPGVVNGLEVNLLDGHDEVLFSQLLPIPDTATQQELDFALFEAFQEFPAGMGGWILQPSPDGFVFGHLANEPMTGGGIEVNLHPGSELSELQLELVGEALFYQPTSPADFNFDGVVNSEDERIWEANYGASGVGVAEGDANLDSNVTGPDLLHVQREMGTEAGFGNAVPEPTGMVPMLTALGTLRLRSRRRRTFITVSQA